MECARGYRSTTLYDSAGEATAQMGACGERTSFVYDGAGRQVATQDALGYYHTTNYDAASRVQSTVDPLGSVTTSVYDIAGQSLGAIDALGRRTTAVYDPAGRSIAQQDARGYLTTLVYDAASQQVALVNANGGRWTTQYDARGMVQANVDPLAARTTFVYNADGLQTLKQDGRGNRITQNYEPRNLPLYTIYPDNAQVTVNFDQGPRMIGEWDSAGRRLLTYDRLGRLTELRNVTQGWRLTYGYDSISNRSFLVAPDGRTTYQYDGDNRCIEVWNPYEERTTWQYDCRGRELRKTHGNGMVASHTYDPAGRETLLANRDATALGLGIYTGVYDAVGIRTGRTELDGTVVTFSYDESYQLIREQRSGAYAYDTTYQYDGDQNRVLKNDSGALTTYQYNAADELLLETPPAGQPTTLTWDASGNRRSENAGGQITTYSWDPENRLTSVARPDGTSESYVYQTDGLRQKKTNAGGTTLFLWDEQNLLLEADPSVVVLARYSDWPGYWGGLAAQRRAGVSSFYCFDLQWSNRVLVSLGGTITDSYAFKAFGEELAATANEVNALRWLGKHGYYRDTELRQQVRARELDVQRSAWLSRDRVDSFARDAGTYVYVENSPLLYADPTGLVVTGPPPPPPPAIRSPAPSQPPSPFPAPRPLPPRLPKPTVCKAPQAPAKVPAGARIRQAVGNCCKWLISRAGGVICISIGVTLCIPQAGYKEGDTSEDDTLRCRQKCDDGDTDMRKKLRELLNPWHGLSGWTSTCVNEMLRRYEAECYIPCIQTCVASNGLFISPPRCDYPCHIALAVTQPWDNCGVYYKPSPRSPSGRFFPGTNWKRKCGIPF